MARKTGSFSATTGPKVREAATKLIAQHGFAAVTMRQIAGAVGLQAGALYSYTPDKNALLFDLLKGHLDQRNAGWSKHAASGDPVAQLESFSKYHLGVIIDAPAASVIARMELRNLAPPQHAEVTALIAQYESALVAIVEAGAEAKLFAVPDAHLAARGVLAMLDGIGDWAQSATLAPERIERISWNMVRRAVGAKGFQ